MTERRERWTQVLRYAAGFRLTPSAPLVGRYYSGIPSNAQFRGGWLPIRLKSAAYAPSVSCVLGCPALKTANLPVSHCNAARLPNDGGWLRWKVENEGFDAQKNRGRGLDF